MHVTKLETLEEAYRIAKSNGGAAGMDGQKFEDIESAGGRRFLRRCGKTSHRQVSTYAEPPGGDPEGQRQSSNTSNSLYPRPRGAGRIETDPQKAVFEADFCPNSYGFRPKRSPHRALAEVRRSVMRRMSTVIDVDLSRYFDTMRHSVLLDKIAKRIQDPQVMHLVKQIIKVGGMLGVPQGGPFSPLAANIYLNEVDWLFDAIRRKTAERDYEAITIIGSPMMWSSPSVDTIPNGAGPNGLCNGFRNSSRRLASN